MEAFKLQFTEPSEFQSNQQRVVKIYSQSNEVEKFLLWERAKRRCFTKQKVFIMAALSQTSTALQTYTLKFALKYFFPQKKTTTTNKRMQRKEDVNWRQSYLFSVCRIVCIKLHIFFVFRFERSQCRTGEYVPFSVSFVFIWWNSQ